MAQLVVLIHSIRVLCRSSELASKSQELSLSKRCEEVMFDGSRPALSALALAFSEIEEARFSGEDFEKGSHSQSRSRSHYETRIMRDQRFCK